MTTLEVRQNLHIQYNIIVFVFFKSQYSELFCCTFKSNLKFLIRYYVATLTVMI